MTLYAQLQTVKSEEDVKDAYIKALGLKSYTKGLIDIQTDEIWFEAKDTGKHSSYAMFTQLLHYVQVALNQGETAPPLLAVIDTEKAAIMKSADVLPFLTKKTVRWGKSASQYTQEALDTISAHIGTHFVSFKISTHEQEFIATVKTAIQTGDIIRTQITPDNLKQVFDKWVAMVGRDFMVQYLADKTLSAEAQAVLDGGRGLWKAYFAETDVRTVRDALKLNRPDVGWYQVRKALQARNASGDTVPVNFGAFERTYQALTEKLQPQVFSLGFLR